MSDLSAWQSIIKRVEILEKRIGGTAVVDTPATYLPFVNYDSLAYNISSNGYPFSATVPRRIVILDWSIAAYVKTTNDGSNYWKIQLRKRDTTLLDELDTSAAAAGAWVLLSGAVSATVTAADIFMYVQIVKSGSPGNMDLGAPMVRCRLG